MKEPVKRMKRQAIDWKKIFFKPYIQQGLITRIYKEFSKLNRKLN